MKINYQTIYMAILMLFSVTKLCSQVTTQPDNTRVKKQTTGTESQKQSMVEFETEIKNKIADLEKEIGKISDEANEKNKSQKTDFKRIYDNLERNKATLKEKIKSYEIISIEKNELFKNEIMEAFKNLEIESKRLVDAMNTPDNAIIKDGDK